MFQQFFAQSDLLIWPLVGLVIFVLSFLGVLWYVLHGLADPRKRERIASLPLDDEKGGTGA
jgi:hypothetical protein